MREFVKACGYASDRAAVDTEWLRPAMVVWGGSGGRKDERQRHSETASPGFAGKKTKEEEGEGERGGEGMPKLGGTDRLTEPKTGRTSHVRASERPLTYVPYSTSIRGYGYFLSNFWRSPVATTPLSEA